jgi:hypothetical protein
MEDEWCIVKYHNRNYEENPNKPEYDLLVRRVYQWEAQRLNGEWEYLAKGLTEKQAMEFNKLF